MNKEQVQEMYISFLQEEGYKGQIDEDGDISFKFEGRLYYFLIDDQDDKFFHLIYPQFWTIESERDLLKAHIVANKLNLQYKIGKVLVVQGGKDVTADVGLYLLQPEDFKKHFERALSILQGMAADFIAYMLRE